MGDHHHGPAKGLSRWLYTTNHKDIGTMYLWFSFAMFLLGGAFAMVIRAELFQPGMQLVEPGFFNQMTTLHGLVMVFGAIMPSFVGLANWLIPMMIGAPDMALPRMNNWSFWILPPAFLMLASTLLMEGGAPAFGWTFYAPLSTTYAPPSVTFFIFAIHILGVSSIMGSINIIATVMNMRAPGMTYMKMPLFVWTWLITAFLLVAVMPVLAGVVQEKEGTYRIPMGTTVLCLCISAMFIWGISSADDDDDRDKKRSSSSSSSVHSSSDDASSSSTCIRVRKNSDDKDGGPMRKMEVELS